MKEPSLLHHNFPEGKVKVKAARGARLSRIKRNGRSVLDRSKRSHGQ
jgi:hypothetical protein